MGRPGRLYTLIKWFEIVHFACRIIEYECLFGAEM